MDFRSLATFVQVAELGSFTRAAEKLGYSQPTVSFQIKQLEKELGIQLFERIGHTVMLTDGGRHTLSYAQSICHLAEELSQGTGELQEARGTIRLAMSDSLCAPLVVRGFGAFRRCYPNISMTVITAGTNDLYRMIDHNEVDLVCTLDTHLYDTSYVIIDEEKVHTHFVCAAEHPLAQRKSVRIEDLLDQPFLLTEKGMSYRRLLDERLARNALKIAPVLEMENADLICHLVGQNLGISFLPDFVTQTAVQEGTVIRLHVEDFEVELWRQLLHHRDKWLSLPMKAIIEHLSQLLLHP